MTLLASNLEDLQIKRNTVGLTVPGPKLQFHEETIEHVRSMRKLLYNGWLQLDVLMYAKRRKVHADDNRAIVLLTNPKSFIGIIYHLKDTRSAYNSAPVLVLSIKHLNNVINILPQ